MAKTNSKKRQYESALLQIKKLREAHLKILNMWNEDPETMNGALIDKYPYAKSLDDIVYELDEWIEDIEDKINEEE